MQVVDYQREGPALGRTAEQLSDRVEESEARLRRARIRGLGQIWQVVAQRRNQLRDDPGAGTEIFTQRFGFYRLRVRSDQLALRCAPSGSRS